MSTYRPIWYAQADISHEVGFICVIFLTNLSIHQGAMLDCKILPTFARKLHKDKPHPTYHQGNKAKCDARQANPSPKQRSADTT